MRLEDLYRALYDPARIFCMTPLRWIVTLNSVAPSLAAICLLSRPLKNSNYFAIVNKRKLALGKEQARGIFRDMSRVPCPAYLCVGN
jgi:hypothetical protein